MMKQVGIVCMFLLCAITYADDKTHEIALTPEEVKAVDDAVKMDSQLIGQLNTLIQQAEQLPVEPNTSMQFHARVKEVLNQRNIISERLRALKAEHRLAHSCPTCEYTDGHTMTPKGGTK